MKRIKKGVIEITLEQLLTDYDWAQVFADENAGNVSKECDPCPPDSNVDCSPVSRTDVKTIIAAVNGENDGKDWVGVFKLKDGRFLLAQGSCDYTGWDCHASNNMEVAKDFESILTIGLNEDQKGRLGL